MSQTIEVISIILALTEHSINVIMIIIKMIISMSLCRYCAKQSISSTLPAPRDSIITLEDGAVVESF